MKWPNETALKVFIVSGRKLIEQGSATSSDTAMQDSRSLWCNSSLQNNFCTWENTQCQNLSAKYKVGVGEQLIFSTKNSVVLVCHYQCTHDNMLLGMIAEKSTALWSWLFCSYYGMVVNAKKKRHPQNALPLASFAVGPEFLWLLFSPDITHPLFT